MCEHGFNPARQKIVLPVLEVLPVKLATSSGACKMPSGTVKGYLFCTFSLYYHYFKISYNKLSFNRASTIFFLSNLESISVHSSWALDLIKLLISICGATPDLFVNKSRVCKIELTCLVQWYYIPPQLEYLKKHPLMIWPIDSVISDEYFHMDPESERWVKVRGERQSRKLEESGKGEESRKGEESKRAEIEREEWKLIGER